MRGRCPRWVDAVARHVLPNRISAADATLRALQAANVQREDASVSHIAPLLILALSAVFGTLAAAVVRCSRRLARRVARNRALQERFGEAMQVSDSQAEAHGLLKTHLQRSIPGASITVLNRNNSGAVLAQQTGRLAVHDSSPIAQSVDQSAPVLANLRNLAVAQTRAATDALTGRRKRRALDETLHRGSSTGARSDAGAVGEGDHGAGDVPPGVPAA